jgi:hypothetical protein
MVLKPPKIPEEKWHAMPNKEKKTATSSQPTDDISRTISHGRFLLKKTTDPLL